jgi:hypothetical protein
MTISKSTETDIDFHVYIKRPYLLNLNDMLTIMNVYHKAALGKLDS